MKLVFYGDDFTGATDTLGTLARGGLRVRLFPRVPSAEQLRAVGPLDAIGIAGAARAMAPEAMRAELALVGQLFESLRQSLNVKLLHYKVCSTFDSSPAIGSIGCAVDTLRPYAANPLVAVVAGQPNLGRYGVFGNLFAAARTGGEVFRLDRHPTMRVHPSTPMHEADLRLHLNAQGIERISNLAYPNYDLNAAELDAHLDRMLGISPDRLNASHVLDPPNALEAPDAVLFDLSHASQLPQLGRLLWQRAQQSPLLVVGSSGVAQALLAAWGDEFVPTQPHHIEPPSGPVFVLAGSLSPVTARQIAAAVSYEHVALDASRLLNGDQAYVDAVHALLLGRLRQGHHVLASTRGSAVESSAGSGAALAAACARLLARLLSEMPLQRVGVAGGDTSSHALQALPINALSYLGELAPGVVMCRAQAAVSSSLDGCELMLKGGQVGGDDLFERLLRGQERAT